MVDVACGIGVGVLGVSLLRVGLGGVLFLRCDIVRYY